MALSVAGLGSCIHKRHGRLRGNQFKHLLDFDLGNPLRQLGEFWLDDGCKNVIPTLFSGNFRGLTFFGKLKTFTLVVEPNHHRLGLITFTNRDGYGLRLI